jgi:hypothetical protein
VGGLGHVVQVYFDGTGGNGRVGGGPGQGGRFVGAIADSSKLRAAIVWEWERSLVFAEVKSVDWLYRL